MNRFRVNLHQAFFDIDTLGTQVESPEAQLERELNELKAPILEEFSSATKNFLSAVNQNQEQKILSRYTEASELRRDQKRFFERINSGKNGKKYSELWNEKIVQGFGDLISALRENKYFDGKNVQAETAKIKEQYWNEVKDQYIDNVWFSSDKKFNGDKDKNNGLKDILFGRESGKDYPANKIYCKLTLATTIFGSERTYVEGYSVDVLNSSQDTIEESVTETVGQTAETDKDDGQGNHGISSEGTKTLVQNQELKGVEQMNGGDIDFLSKTLPIYLWEYSRITKRVGDRGTKIRESVIGFFGVEARFDRPSRSEEGAINNFLKAASKLEFQKGYDGDKALALMDVFHDNRLNENSGRAVYRNVLRDHKIDIGKMSKSIIDDIIKAGSFYLRTQKADNSVRDQHAIYLSVLKVIETEGGVKNAVNKFRDIVEQGKEDRKKEKKQGYESDENLGEFKGFAEKLGISDFVSFNRLLRKETEYFDNTPVEKILANLNNDNIIATNDTIAGGSKTGNQFLEIFNQVGKERALHNLLEHAKLLNKTLGLGLDENDFNEGNIKNKNYKLIILLQNIINRPGEDLYILLSGHKEGGSVLDMFDAETLQKAETEGEKREAAFIEAGKIIEEKGFLKEYKKLFDGKEGVDVSNFADLQATLASCLYDNYKLGLGVGGTVNLTFNEWVKGITISTGAQVRDNKGAMLGLNIGYSKSFNVGNGWTLTPGLSAGIFLPIAQGSEKVLKSVGLNFTADKKKVNLNTGTVHHSGFGMSYDVVTNTLSLGWHENRNKIEGLQEAATFQSQKFEQVIMRDLLDNIKNNIPEKEGKKIMDLDDSNILDIVNSNIIKEIMSQNDISEGDQEKIVGGMLRMLAVYNKVDLNKSGVKYVIAKKIAEEYEHSWIEQRKVDIQKGGTYISGYGVGAFWKVGTTRLGIYAGANFSKHNADGYGDKWGNEQKLESENIGEWNDGLLKNFNKQLGWLDAVRICMKSVEKQGGGKKEYIYIPASVTNRVNVNPRMKGLMKKNEDGSVFLDVHTPMSVFIGMGAATQWSEVIIGGKEMEEGQSFQKLDALGADWFKNDINQDSVLDLIESAEYNVDGLDEALGDLKAKLPSGDIIQNFSFSGLPVVEQKRLISGLNSLDRKQKVKIVLENIGEEIIVSDFENVGNGRGLEIEYNFKFEMMDSEAKQVADAVFAEALKVKNPKVLHAVKHHPWLEYAPFSAAMTNKDYTLAKQTIKPIFERLDREIDDSNIKFSKILDDNFNKLEGDALAQALMAINNVFARSRQVRGGKDDEYEFKWPDGRQKEMGDIIDERKNILKTLNGKLDRNDVKAWYKELFDSVSNYVKKNPNLFNVTSSKFASLGNTIGFNLGDKDNPENPLFNPEAYANVVDAIELEEKYGLTKQAREGLHKRSMESFAKTPALVNPVLKMAGISTDDLNLDDIVNQKNMRMNGNRCELDLDIGDKKYTLSSGMKFGFFPQCVNHMLILTDIMITGADGTNVSFNSGVWENGRYVEGDKSTIVSTAELGVSGSVVLDKEGQSIQQPEAGETNMGGDRVDPEKPETTTIVIGYDADGNPIYGGGSGSGGSGSGGSGSESGGGGRRG